MMNQGGLSLEFPKVEYKSIRDGALFFYQGLPFLGLADNFFLKNNAFQTFFSVTFCNENNFLRPFQKTLQAFL